MIYKSIYKESVDQLNPSPELIEKIKSGKEKKLIMYSKKKVAVLAVVACMALGTTVFAAGKITGFVSWSSPASESADYNSVAEYAETNGLQADIPETLSNGYGFDSSNVGGTKAVDDAGNTVAEGDKLQVTYRKEGGSDIYLYVSSVFEEEYRDEATESRYVNGVMVYYSKDTYKFVPTDYEYTEEDKENEKGAHFYISYGSDEVEIQNVDSIFFEIGGKNYNLMSWDCDMSADDWFSLAEDFIK